MQLIATLIVTGFTDPIGSDISNMALGQRRAEAVKTLLIAHCSCSLQEQKACYASERRVIISVENK